MARDPLDMLLHAAAALLVGATAGTHVATWGMYKDSLYEGFCARKYARSIVVGALAALLIQLLIGFDLGSPAGVLLLFGTTYSLERWLVESWKAFVREENQGKYFIPMAFAVGGRVVTDRLTRRLAGVGYAAAVTAVIAGLIAMQPWYGARPSLRLLVVAGSLGGWISAFGGAWKDAPKEGFQVLKFFRSPALSLSFALLLAQLTSSLVVIAFGALGLTIATIETHKKFDRPGEAPGKFSGKPVTHPHMMRLRRPALALYAAIWALVLGTIAAALADLGTVPALREIVAVARG